MKKFDLNIEKVLEDWEIYHGVREIIANALDEQVLSQSKEIEIFQVGDDFWHIRDYGRGIKYEHLTQKENEEKLQNSKLIGKFGVGLKDALATFDRRGIKVLIRSAYGEITLGKSEKYDFEDVVTLHAYLSPPSDYKFIGTDFILQGLTKDDVNKAKNLFLKFAGENILEITPFGEILQKKKSVADLQKLQGPVAKIYINGVKVAEEENFLFSYNITSLNTAIKKALNRERTNVGRTAYTDRIKAILLSCKNKLVAEELTKDLKEFETGYIHDELKWSDVSAHAAKLLNSSENEKVVFCTPNEIMHSPSIVYKALNEGYRVVTIPNNVERKISGQIDIAGKPILDFNQFRQEWNNSFEFKFVDIKNLTSSEKTIFDKTEKIIEIIGGLPTNVREIKISETMRMQTFSNSEAVGLWEANTGRIIIKRDQLKNIEQYAGILLHEIAHALTGAPDISSSFEMGLTELLGKIASSHLMQSKTSRWTKWL